MIVRVQWLCEHAACLRAYEDEAAGEYAPYDWACTLKRTGITAVLVGVRGMPKDKIALGHAIRDALNRYGIYEVWFEKVRNNEVRIVHIH